MAAHERGVRLAVGAREELLPVAAAPARGAHEPVGERRAERAPIDRRHQSGERAEGKRREQHEAGPFDRGLAALPAHRPRSGDRK